jgi:hypothetical protein
VLWVRPTLRLNVRTTGWVAGSEILLATL